jgi:hypothetical protein
MLSQLTFTAPLALGCGLPILVTKILRIVTIQSLAPLELLLEVGT